jgi:uncharacterized surface protein with fasciclin (FAS1) repeats
MNWILAFAVAFTGVGSMHAAEDLVTAAQRTGRCKTFVKVIQAAGLTQTIKGYGALTVFAPVDDGFAKFPKDILDELMQPANKTRLAGLVLAHILKGKMMAADAKTMTATTLGDSKIHLAKDGSSLRYGDANVVKADLVASNGVIHLIDKVVLPEQQELPAEKKSTRQERNRVRPTSD